VELLGRAEERAGDAAIGEAAAPPGVCLPELPDRSAIGTFLEVRELSAAV
jgi:hypothetical protein